MQLTTPSSRHLLSSKSAIIALLIVAALTSLAPGRASADSPTVIRGASTAVLAIRASVGVTQLPSFAVLRDAPKPAKGGFVSEDLLEKATELVNNGVRIGELAGGKVYVHAQPKGFGGVVSIRYRR